MIDSDHVKFTYETQKNTDRRKISQKTLGTESGVKRSSYLRKKHEIFSSIDAMQQDFTPRQMIIILVEIECLLLGKENIFPFKRKIHHQPMQSADLPVIVYDIDTNRVINLYLHLQ